MEKYQLEKAIRKGVVAGITLLFFMATAAIGHSLKLAFFPDTDPKPDEIAFPREKSPLKKREAKREIASIPAHANGEEPSADLVPDRSGGGTTTIHHFSAGGESSPAFMEQLSSYFETGYWPDPGKPSTRKGDSSPSSLTQGYGASLSGARELPTTGSSPSATAGADADGAIAPVNDAEVFTSTAIVTGGAINGTTNSGYRVSAFAASPLSSGHIVTNSGHQIWLNESSQISPP